MFTDTNESDLDELCGQLSAIIDEMESGEPWTGEAALLAHRVRRLIEDPDPFLPMASDPDDVVERYRAGFG